MGSHQVAYQEQSYFVFHILVMDSLITFGKSNDHILE